MHRPSEKVRQAEYEREETAHRRDARAQKDREHHCCRLRLEEGRMRGTVMKGGASRRMTLMKTRMVALR